MSAEEGSAEVPRGVDVLEPAVLSPAEQFLAAVDPLVQDYGIALRNVRTVVRQAVSDDTIISLLETDYEEMANSSREERRFDQAYIRGQRDDMVLAVMQAKNDAQVFEIGTDPSDKEAVLAEVASHQMSSSEEAGSKYAYLRHQSRFWLETFEAERQKIQLEVQLLDATISLLQTHGVAVLIDLLAACNDPARDPDELRPFLQFLAKNHFDPFETSLIEASLEVMDQQPELSHNSFLATVDDCFSEDNQTREAARQVVPSEIIEWFTYLRAALQMDTGQVAPSTLLSAVPRESWPTSVQDLFRTQHQKLLQATKESYLDLLSPYKDPSNFYIRDEDLAKIQRTVSPAPRRAKRSAGKRKQGGGSRVTQRAPRAEDYVVSKEAEDTDPKPVAKVTHLLKTPQGHVHAEHMSLDDEGITDNDIETGLLSLKPVAEYLASKLSDSDIRRDLLSMLKSLLDEPRGNGAEKTTDLQISISNGQGNNRRVSVWRLNTNKRTNLSVGDVARQTRIFYTLTRDDADRPVLGILDVNHKASGEKIRGGWKRTLRK